MGVVVTEVLVATVGAALLIYAVTGMLRTTTIVEPEDLMARAVPNLPAIASVGQATATSFDALIGTHIAMLTGFYVAVVGRQISGTSDEVAQVRVLLGLIAQLSTSVVMALGSTILVETVLCGQDASRLFIVVPELALAFGLTVQLGSYSLVRLSDRLAEARRSISRAQERSIRIRSLRGWLGLRAGAWEVVCVLTPILISIAVAAFDAPLIPVSSWWRIAVALAMMSTLSFVGVGTVVLARLMCGRWGTVCAILCAPCVLLGVLLSATEFSADRGAVASACLSAVGIPVILAGSRVRWLVSASASPLALRIATIINAANAGRADKIYRDVQVKLACLTAEVETVRCPCCARSAPGARR